jgi:hypothetical protein
MLTYRFPERAEDDARLRELSLVGCPDRDAVEDGIDRHPGEELLLGQRDTQLLVGFQ